MDSKDNTTVEIPLTKGYVAIVDAIDADLVKTTWCALEVYSGPYACKTTRYAGKRITLLLHRVILERILNRPLNSTELVDHRDGNTLNNRRQNLRLATGTQNQGNAKLRKDNTSGYKGVCYCKTTKKWKAAIGKNTIGRFDTPEEAYEAYCQKAKELFGEFARLK